MWMFKKAKCASKLTSHALFRHAVRRVKRSQKQRQAEGLFKAGMEGDISLFKEMKRIRTGGGEVEELAESVDGSYGQTEIADTFAKTFQTLYNSAENSSNEMKELQTKIQELVDIEDSYAEVEKVTLELVKRAAHKMDLSRGFTSDALLHGPDSLFKILSSIF